MRPSIKRPLLVFCFYFLASCGQWQTQEVRFFEAGDYPEKLSDWRIIWQHDDRLETAPASITYRLNTSLFSDYALKLRTLYIPPQERAQYHASESFNFPVGTVVSKTFFYRSPNRVSVSLDSDWSGGPEGLDTRNIRLIETRLLVRQENGWDALPYVWQGDDAYLKITGTLIELKIANEESPIHYLVPSKNQCASCHVTDHTDGSIRPIGLKARHLNHSHTASGENQLIFLANTNRLKGLPTLTGVGANANFNDPTEPIERRARAYLDINCSHCHNAKGPADTSALLLEHSNSDPRSYGVCKPPIASGRGSGGLLYSIIPGLADRSIMPFRLASRDPAEMMPELGRTLVHEEGVSLISQWINSMSGRCI